VSLGGGDLFCEVLWAVVQEVSVTLGTLMGGLSVSSATDTGRTEPGDQPFEASQLQHFYEFQALHCANQGLHD
jgi:hypothetical protein